MNTIPVSPLDDADPLGGYVLHPNYVVRIGGEASSALARLNEGRADTCWKRIVALRSEVDRGKKTLCAMLERLVPECNDRDTVRAILNAKRAIFAGRAVAAKDAGHILASRFADQATGLAHYVEQFAALEANEAMLPAAHADDLANSASSVAELAQGINLRAGVSYSAPALSQSLRGTLGAAQAKPLKAKALRNIEDSALQYFARCATKTSPLSSFTPIHVGSWEDASGSDQLNLSAAILRRVEMKAGLVHHLFEPAINDFQFVKASFPLMLNQSVRVENDQLRYDIITPGQELSGRTWGTGLQQASMAANPVMRCIAAILLNEDSKALDSDSLVARTCALIPGMTAERLWPFVEKLFSIGYLIADTGLVEQVDALDWAERLIAKPGFPGRDRVKEILANLRAALAVMEGDDILARETAAGDIRRILAELAGATGADPTSAMFNQPFYENCYLQQAGPGLDPAMLAPFAIELDLINQLSHLLDPNQELHCRLADYFVDQFGQDGRCPDIAGFLREFDRIYAPGVLDAEIQAEHTAPISAQTQCLLDAKREFDRLLDPQLELAADVTLDLQALQRIVDLAPWTLRNRKISYSHVVQFVQEQDRRRLVLNQVFGGRSSILSRFLEVLDEPAVERVRDYIKAGSNADLVAELPGVFGFNANRHPPLADNYLHIPPFPRPDTERAAIDLASLALTYDADQHRVVFSDQAGMIVDIFYQGLLIPALMPQLHRVLSLGFSEGPSFAIVKAVAQRVMRPGRELAAVPRISIGNVVLFRRSVLMQNRLLPDANCPADEFYRAVRQWQQSHDLPDRFFIRSLPLANTTAADGKGKIDWQSVNFKDMKPFYVDLRSPRFVRLLQNMVKRNELAVTISELLPDFSGSPFAIEDEPHVAELHFEMSLVQPRAKPDQLNWQVIRVAWFDEDRDALMRGPIKETVEVLRRDPAVRRVTVAPHWIHGPHVDISLEAPARDFLARIFPNIRAIISRWLAENPSTIDLDPAAYDAKSRGIALFELNPGPYLPLLDNNRVTLAIHQPPVGLAIPQLADLRASFLDESLTNVFAALELKRDNRDEFFRLLGAMLLTTADSFASGMADGYLSLRSHADYFFAAHDLSGQVRARFDGFDRHWAAEFDAMAQAIASREWELMPLACENRRLIIDWAEVVSQTNRRSRALVEANHAALIGQSVHQDLARGMAANDDSAMRRRFAARKISDLGDAFLNSERGQKVQQSPDFLTYRTNVNFFYLLLPILGVTPVQKFLLCDLVARSVERVFARDWRKTISAIATGARS